MKQKVSWNISYSLKSILIDHNWLLKYILHRGLISI